MKKKIAFVLVLTILLALPACGSAEEIQSVFSDIAIKVTEVVPEKKFGKS